MVPPGRKALKRVRFFLLFWILFACSASAGPAQAQPPSALREKKILPGEQYRHRLVEMIRTRFRGRKLDPVLTLRKEALDFLLKEGKEVSPEGPIISVQGDPTFFEYDDPGRPLIYLPFAIDVISTARDILRLRPDTKETLVLSGSSAARNSPTSPGSQRWGI